MLTDKEKKRLKRMKKLEKQKEINEKIKIKLIEPPPPRVNLKNFMVIMKNQAITDPTRAEEEAKKIMEQRKQQHLKHNEDRKISKEKRSDKEKKKVHKSINEECGVMLFRIDHLRSPQLKFKIDKNAQQLYITGICIIPDPHLNLPVMIVAEGAKLPLIKYYRLLMRRIKWKSPPKIEEMTEEDYTDLAVNKCSYIWKGITKKPSFDRWKVVNIKQVKQFLKHF